jgi:hypothetical protein
MPGPISRSLFLPFSHSLSFGRIHIQIIPQHFPKALESSRIWKIPENSFGKMGGERMEIKKIEGNRPGGKENRNREGW